MMDISQYLKFGAADDSSLNHQDGFEVWIVVIVLFGSLLACLQEIDGKPQSYVQAVDLSYFDPWRDLKYETRWFWIVFSIIWEYLTHCGPKKWWVKEEKAQQLAPNGQPRKFVAPIELHMPFFARIHTIHGYFILFCKACVRETCLFVLRAFGLRKEDKEVRWMGGWQDLFLRHAYRRIEDCWNRTIDTAADVTVSVKLRDRPFQLLGPFTDFEFTGESRMCINMASYNYLGFGGFDSDCTPAVHEAIDTSGAATCSTGIEAGYTEEQKDLEQTVCRFLDKEDAIVVGMGYGTNATLLPAIIGPSGGRVLVVSDELNHRSIVEGVRLANAKVRTFLHNDMDHLDQVLREACESKKFDAILIVVEGIYSMEGDLGRIREIVSLKKKYGAMMYLDEAHSIGAVGKTGRGVCELLGVPTSDVDIMMGTFTKSFGSVGGYVASTKSIIDRIRNDSPASAYAMSMSVPAIVQANKAFAVIMGPDGKGTPKGLKKIQQLDDNSCYFRERLRKMGCKVLGDMNSPVVPVMLFHNEKISIFSRLCLSRGLAVVVVGYPATPVFLSRVRFCLSAGHTRKMLDDALEIIEWAATATGILYDKGNPEETEEEKEYSKAMRTAPLFIGKVNCALDSQKILGALPVQSCHSPPPSPSGVRAGRANDKIELRKHDHLSLMTHPLTNVVKKAHMAIDHYGCGTCGPRGFYGTTPLHLDVEKHMAEFLGQEACISYSNFLATTSSVIPAFAKRNDVCFVDEECNYGVIAGLRLARADVVVFKHNDAEDLKRCMEEHAVACEKMKDGFKGRKFVITEGVFANRGTIAPLPEIVALKKKHRAWLILDESYSIGVLGEGKGLSAHFGIPASDIDMQIGSFEHAFGSIGGFCAGAHRIVWHQVLSGAGYCFSASAPPYAMAWIDECISEFNKKGKSTLKTRAARVVEDSTKLYAQLEKEFAGIREIEVSGSEGSPLVLLRGNPEALSSICARLQKVNIYAQLTTFCNLDIGVDPKNCPRQPALKFCLTSGNGDGGSVDLLATQIIKAVRDEAVVGN